MRSRKPRQSDHPVGPPKPANPDTAKPSLVPNDKPDSNDAAKLEAISGKATNTPAKSNKKTKAQTPGEQPLRSPSHASSKPNQYIVGIGASAGGLEALEEFFRNTPADTGLSYVVVTHQHPGHTSMLAEILSKSSAMPTAEVKDNVLLEPNRVYVQPPGAYMTIGHGRLHLVSNPVRETPPLPIDSFFRSMAEELQERAICVVLSGTGSDGTLGLKAIKGVGGLAIVQEVQSARYTGMPSSAIATSMADFIVPPSRMPQHLIAYVGGLTRQQVPGDANELPTDYVQPLQRIFSLLRSRTGHDFSLYKMNTMRRRIERRMVVQQLQHPSEYARHLQDNPHEIDALFRELLISVTSFFRDPEAFACVNGHLENLIASRPEGYAFRAWVPGCSTGEEAYSLAITLRECATKLKRSIDFQVFGTDLDAEAIEFARNGEYPLGIAADVPADMLEKYFVHNENSYRIRKEIREMLVFAQQNVIKDPPFTKLDLLSCRNVLIYLNSDLQRRLLPIFHYALKPDGLMMLGPSETIGTFEDILETVDKRWKIYRRKATVAGRRLPEIPAQPRMRDDAPPKPSGVARPSQPAHLSGVVEKNLLTRFAPPSVVVSDRGEIVYLHGRTGQYLEPVVGQPRMNILEMAREGLQLDLASALREGATHRRQAIRENVRVRTNGGYSLVNITVVSMEQPEAVKGLLLVTFQPAGEAGEHGAKGKNHRKGHKPDKGRGGSPGRVSDLEHELQLAKESLQTTVEQLEASNEELKSANEELQSTNEEFQSTNEEMETSKEEMQSLNEELTTVNAELQSKVDELSRANDDMQNLLNSTDIATIFLDNNLNIKRFTEQARKLVRLIPTDVGRPLGDLSSIVDCDGLVDMARDVLKTLVYKEQEVSAKNGAWYLMRMVPYRTSDNVIDGLVITFVDIKRVKQAEQESLRAKSFFEGVFDMLRLPMMVLSEDLRVVAANRAFCETFRTTRRQMEGEHFIELGGGEWDVPKLGEALGGALASNSAFEGVEIEGEFPRIGRRRFVLRGHRIERHGVLPNMVVITFEDPTPSGKSGT